MTDNNKQFILNDDLSDLQDCKCVMDNYADVDTWYTLGATVDLLNELLKENEQLKEECYGNLDGLETYKELYSHLSEKFNNLEADYDDLRKENEQLKSVVKKVIELLSEEVDVFSDKATEHDINAYIELKELDNKDAYYMATATKEAIKLLRGIVNE